MVYIIKRIQECYSNFYYFLESVFSLVNFIQ